MAGQAVSYAYINHLIMVYHEIVCTNYIEYSSFFDVILKKLLRYNAKILTFNGDIWEHITTQHFRAAPHISMVSRLTVRQKTDKMKKKI